MLQGKYAYKFNGFPAALTGFVKNGYKKLSDEWVFIIPYRKYGVEKFLHGMMSQFERKSKLTFDKTAKAIDQLFTQVGLEFISPKTRYVFVASITLLSLIWFPIGICLYFCGFFNKKSEISKTEKAKPQVRTREKIE